MGANYGVILACVLAMGQRLISNTSEWRGHTSCARSQEWLAKFRILKLDDAVHKLMWCASVLRDTRGPHIGRYG
jgi:hypothetical protein